LRLKGFRIMFFSKWLRLYSLIYIDEASVWLVFHFNKSFILIFCPRRKGWAIFQKFL